ncbi:MAG: hypothetical protein AAGA60_33070, partial [Cyanobacteria bacterium P01_E01_bin.42]
YIPIAEQFCPILPESHVLAVSARSDTAKPTWFWAGWCYQRLNIGVTPGGSFDTYGDPRRSSVELGLNLLVFPKLTDDYVISFFPPKWFRDIEYIVWQFTRPTDSNDCTQLIQAQNEQNELNYLQLQTSIDRLQQDIDRLNP